MCKLYKNQPLETFHNQSIPAIKKAYLLTLTRLYYALKVCYDNDNINTFNSHSNSQKVKNKYIIA